ncbi:Phospholipase/Carboxylesterase-domain-containing protein [Melampsora americana]|nr:Phospholipase/Carboxylesterase-domain-containing protein [Melampsora americana]
MSYSQYNSNSLSLDISDHSKKQPQPNLLRSNPSIHPSNSLSTQPSILSSSSSSSSMITSKRIEKLKSQVPFLILCSMISLIWFIITFFQNFSIFLHSPFHFFPNSTHSLLSNHHHQNQNQIQWTTLPILKSSEPIHYEVLNSTLTSTDSSSSSSTSSSNTTTIIPDPNGWTILTLHGLGSINASDAYFLRDHLLQINPTLFHQIKFVIPFAKRLSVDVWDGHQTPAWFNIHDWSDLRSKEDSTHMKENVGELDEILKDLQLDMKKTIFMGFSQGAVMSLLLSLNVDRPPAGVLMLSGFLPVPKQLPQMISPNRKGISSLYWSHGESDPFFPISNAQVGFESIQSLGFFKSTQLKRFKGLDHRFDLNEIISAVRWIEEVIEKENDLNLH